MTNEQFARFLELICDDLKLNDVDIPLSFVHKIKNEYNNQLVDQPLGYFRYRPDSGYDIQIRIGLSDYSTLITSAHELRHVYQHKNKIYRGWKWNGKRISKTTPYKKLPWEVDADLYALQKTHLFARLAGIRI